MDQVDELIKRSVDHPELRRFHAFHKKRPEILDFLTREIQARIRWGLGWYSLRGLYEYARLKIIFKNDEEFKLNNNLLRFYGRVLVILHPEFLGYSEFRDSYVDDILGVEIVPRLPGDYGRANRLRWTSGLALTDGWRPSTPHVPRFFAKVHPDIHARVR